MAQSNIAQDGALPDSPKLGVIAAAILACQERLEKHRQPFVDLLMKPLPVGRVVVGDEPG